ncbi:MAG: ABC transporter ATP-binding protein [Eubacteriales bacterium]
MLELKNIDKIFNRGTVNEMQLFDKFSLSVGKGEFVSVVGSNGSGKTTMLNIICGSIPIEGGEIIVGGKNITRVPEYKRYKTIGRVYQDPAMGTCPHLTIAENMALAEQKGGISGLSFGISRKRINYYKELLSPLGLGLEDKMDINVGLLSGGQRQAMALIMTTLTPIDILILDEHTAALDPKTAELIMEITDKVIKEKSLTALMVTHNLRYAVEYGNRIIMMHDGRAVLDKSGVEKERENVDDLLSLFNAISVECGN